MNHKSLVKLSNTVGVISIVLLIYWVFAFISITVFGLKVFRENLTETFYLSVVGILSLMIGSLIINIMFNLTRIAEKHNLDKLVESIPSKRSKLGLLFGLSFPLVFGLLIGGDSLTASKKERMLIASAKSMIENYHDESDKLLHYSFTESWIMEADSILDLFSSTDTHFPQVSIIVPDQIDQAQVFLGFREYYGDLNDTIQPGKKDFVKKTTFEERNYLSEVFFKNSDKVRFSAHDGSYELFYPYIKDGKRIVLYFSDYQRFGK